jgi:hypothetical protein
VRKAYGGSEQTYKKHPSILTDGGGVGRVLCQQIRCVTLPQDENALISTYPTTGIFSTVLRTEACKGASESIKS